MKRTLATCLLVSTALLGLPGCASDQAQKSDQAKKTEPAKDDRPMEQRLTVGMT
jgi:hypothetical protein